MIKKLLPVPAVVLLLIGCTKKAVPSDLHLWVSTEEVTQDVSFYTTTDTIMVDGILYKSKADSLLVSGQEKIKSENYSGALSDLDKAISIKPHLQDAYYYRAQTYLFVNNAAAALKDLNQVIEWNENNIAAYHLRGDTRYKTKDYQGAIKDFDLVLQETPENVMAYYSRGLAKAEAGDHKGALLDFNLFLDGNESYPGVTEFAGGYTSRGDTKRKLKDKKGACADWQIASDKGDATAAARLRKYCK
ncbi:MAG: tetratricopeptide repeat protein [Adhaeribacter sp.]